MAKDLKITVPLHEMQTATTDKKLSLTSFCKLNGLAKTTVWKYCKAANINTSKGLTVETEDALRHEYGLPLVSEIQTAIQEAQLMQQQTVAENVDGVLEGEMVHVPSTVDLPYGLVPTAPTAIASVVNEGQSDDLELAAQNLRLSTTQNVSQISNVGALIGQVMGKEVTQGLSTIKENFMNQATSAMLNELSGGQQATASQKPHTPPPMNPKQKNGKR